MKIKALVLFPIMLGILLFTNCNWKIINTSEEERRLKEDRE